MWGASHLKFKNGTVRQLSKRVGLALEETIKKGVEPILATGFCLSHLLFSSNERAATSSSVNVTPYCLAIVWMISGHCISAAERVRKNVGIPSCLIMASTSYCTLWKYGNKQVSHAHSSETISLNHLEQHTLILNNTCCQQLPSIEPALDWWSTMLASSAICLLSTLICQ